MGASATWAGPTAERPAANTLRPVSLRRTPLRARASPMRHFIDQLGRDARQGRSSKPRPSFRAERAGALSFRAQCRRRAGARKQRADEESPSFGSGPGLPVGTIMGLTTEVTEATANNKTARTWWSLLRGLGDLGGYIDRPLRPSKRIPPVGMAAIPRLRPFGPPLGMTVPGDYSRM